MSNNHKDPDYKSKWYAKNRERILKARKEGYKSDYKEKIKYQKEYALKHPEEIKALKKEIKLRPETRFRDGKWRAKKRKLEWSISFPEFVELTKLPCYYCYADLSKHCGVGLDRVDNSKGYSIDNVVPCCSICNRGRNKFFTLTEWKVMMDALLAWRKK